MRLTDESKRSASTFFVTLTYDEAHLPRQTKKNIGTFGVLRRSDIQLYLKRLRKKFNEKEIRFYCLGEYGPHTYRPHYHLLIFFRSLSPLLDEVRSTFSETWGKGFVWTDAPTSGRIAYVAKYHTIRTFAPRYLPESFTLKSTRPGLGVMYYFEHMLQLNTDGINLWDTFHYSESGPDGALPRYYRNLLPTRSVSAQAAEHVRSLIDHGPSQGLPLNELLGLRQQRDHSMQKQQNHYGKTNL